MNKTKALLFVSVVFLVLMFAALVSDSVRMVRSSRELVQRIDSELKLNEERLISTLSSSPIESRELQDALARYKAATSLQARHEAYSEVVNTAQKTLYARTDVSNPLVRRFADEVAGALNRRQIAERHYQEILAACNETSTSLRGQIAKWVIDVPNNCEE